MNTELIYEVEEYVWNNPEPGYREWKTSKYMAEKFEAFGYDPVMFGNIPGCGIL